MPYHRSATVMNDRQSNRPLLVVTLALICASVGVAYASASSEKIRITEGPPPRTTENEATFAFKASGMKVACRRDGLRYRPCQKGIKYTGLRGGNHTFTLRAMKGDRVVKTVRRSWTVARRSGRLVKPSAKLPPKFSSLIFADEFNGTEVDAAAWARYDSVGHAGRGLRRPSAFSLDGKGHLVVTAKMAGKNIVSGGMAQRLNFTYGRVVFRVRTEADPTGTMSGVVLTWPQEQWSPEFTENDMYETGWYANNDYRFDSFLHFSTNHSWQKWFMHDSDPTKWHTIEMDWRPDQLSIYRDGALVWSVTDRAVIPDIMHHVCIQLDPKANRRLKKPVRMFVDYVRVYR